MQFPIASTALRQQESSHSLGAGDMDQEERASKRGGGKARQL